MTDAHPHASIRYWTIGKWREAKIAEAVARTPVVFDLHENRPRYEGEYDGERLLASDLARADDGFDPEVIEWARRRLRETGAARMKPGQIRPHTMPRRWWEFWR